MTDQLDIHGNIIPTTWDGEPLYSPATVAEGLFDADAFQQISGQTFMSMLGNEYFGYDVVDRMSGKLLAGPFPRNVDAFNAARALGPNASVRERS